MEEKIKRLIKRIKEEEVTDCNHRIFYSKGYIDGMNDGLRKAIALIKIYLCEGRDTNEKVF